MKKLAVATDSGEIQWPRECASCCATEDLRPVHVGIAKNVTGLADVAVGRRRYQTLGVHYFACGQHAGWAAFASWLTRKSPLPNLLRGAAYWIGIPGFLIFLLKAAGGVMSLLRPAKTAADPYAAPAPVLFLLLFAACAVLLVLVLVARRRVPVRLLKLEEDEIVLGFANDRYARHFARANDDIVVPRG